MPSTHDTLSVFVTGDVTIDWNIAHISSESNELTDWTGGDSCRMKGQFGSAALLCRMSWQYGSAALLADLITSMAYQLKSDQPFSIEVATTHSALTKTIDPYDTSYCGPVG